MFTQFSCGNHDNQDIYSKEYIGPQELGYRVTELFNSKYDGGIALFADDIGKEIGIRFPGEYTAEEIKSIFDALSKKEKKKFLRLINELHNESDDIEEELEFLT